MSLPDHVFWPDDLPFADAIPATTMLAGHRQITDAYLLGLAIAHGGIVATLDADVLSLAGRSVANVELISSS